MTNSADPDLHCLLRQSISCSAREGLRSHIVRPKSGFISGVVVILNGTFFNQKSNDNIIIFPRKSMLWYS